ncbi:unnamed protein product [Kluyveromyces dobzhanskii CBS 2104]|uniref:WGS project CCBQ000000000 data, contig 00272 n=1 Tax=Kluyveromyces dobzhanskii CBS 2104 TaxID=1427455 RepID=A0A0A8L8J0_9SACH|nr:unnamed protein product [Kluyveromyces dobzhanskii CBS 2104]
MSFVLVSGASGYIAQHTIRILLAKGYKVIGTVRTQEKADSVARLFNNDNLALELVPELADIDAFDHVFEKYNTQIKHVIHTASPVRYNMTDFENEMLLPAINGTKSVLESIKKFSADSVETVVYTSSISALANPAGIFEPETTLTEESWNPDTWEDAIKDVRSAYFGSKTFAERSTWQFIEENRDQVKFQLTTICPGYVLGPQAFDENAKGHLCYSGELVNGILTSKPGDTIDQHLAGAFIDVRDVARAHVLPLEDHRFANQRLVLMNKRFALQDVADYISGNFPELKGKISVGVPGSGADTVETTSKYDNSKTRELLGFDFVPFEKSVTDSVDQILAANKE